MRVTRHLTAIRTLSDEELTTLIATAKSMQARSEAGQPLPDLSKKVAGMLFFENSTRTRVSFEQAARHLGMGASEFSAASSMSKGETLKDTVLTLRHEGLDALVLRHPASGAAALAARHFGGPVLNAGDGEHEHPTQAVADALTVLKRKGRIEGLTVAIVGDVRHSRVARSDAWLFNRLGANIRLVGPRTLMPASETNLPGEIHYDLASGIAGADVVIALRLQRERMERGLIGSLGEYRAGFGLDEDALSVAQDDVLVMHPGPINRGVELDDVTADGPRSAIADQIRNGVHARVAAFVWVFAAE
ncbi:MAG: aspartate carbamoyltransferase [Armatimonadota bacterium]